MIISGWDIATFKTGIFFFDTNEIRFKSYLLEARGSDLYDRIRQIHHKSKDLINKYNPEMLIIEDTYLDDWRKNKGNSKKRGNVNTLKALEKAHGAILSNTTELMDIIYMPPTEHKELLTGMGNASKQSTIWMVQKKLGVANWDDNQSDAASLVLAYLVKRQQWDILEKIKQKFE